MKTYALYAYKSDSVDTCRGCVMARYSSDSILERGLTIEQLAERIADLKNKERGYGERDYDFQYFEDGPDLEDWENDHLQKLIGDYEAATAARKKATEEAAAQKKAVQAAEVETKRVAAQEKHDREEFERLKTKFGKNQS